MEPSPAATEQPKPAPKLVLIWRVVVGLTILWLGVALVVPGARPAWATPTASAPVWGWDETMHAELPAVQMLLYAQRGEWHDVMEVVHECDRYPFGYPAALAVWQGVVGVGQLNARHLGTVFFFLLVLLAVRLSVQLVGVDQRIDAALLVGLAAISAPLARRYAPTLFLEVPALVMIAASMSAWISRRRCDLGTKGRVRRDLFTGILIAATFFTKFNYALLLGLALGLDAAIELIVVRGRRSAWASLLRTGLPLLVGLLWWFLIPLPFGAEVAAEHRGDFMDFVTGNTEMTMAAWLRATNWFAGIAPHTFLFAALGILSLVLLAVRRTRTAVTLALALAAFVVPIVMHPFQLDRFLLPAGLGLWVLGGSGAALFLRASPALFTATALGIGIACANVSVLTTAAWVGFPLQPEGTAVREFQEYHVGTTISLFGAPASNGLTAVDYEKVMDMIAEAVGPDDSVGWLGQSTEVSPASLNLALLERGGSADRFLEFAPGPMDIELLPSNVRSDHSLEELLEYARRFDHVIIPAQGDLIGRGGREWVLEAWHQPLRDWPDAHWQTLGTVVIDRNILGPLPITFELLSVPQ